MGGSLQTTCASSHYTLKTQLRLVSNTWSRWKFPSALLIILKEGYEVKEIDQKLEKEMAQKNFYDEIDTDYSIMKKYCLGGME